MVFPRASQGGAESSCTPSVTGVITQNAPRPWPEEDILTQELFATDLETVEALLWNDLVVEKWRILSQKGLPAEQRDLLLAKYTPPDTLAFLKAPQLNQELKSGLKANSIVKRDVFNAKDQSQVGNALCVLGEAISELLKPDDCSLQKHGQQFSRLQRARRFWPIFSIACH